MTKVSLCRNAIQPFDMKTVKQQEYYLKDSKMRCPYSDKKFSHKARLAKHTELNETICFNFLHKLTTGGFENGKLFTSETMVHYDGKYMRMCDIEFTTNIESIQPIELLNIEPVIPPIELLSTIDNEIDNEIIEGLDKLFNNHIDNINSTIDIIEENIDILSDISDTSYTSDINATDIEDNLFEDINMPDDTSDDEINDINVNLNFDEYDDELQEIKKNEYLRIIDVINDNPHSDLLFYKCITRDEYDNIQYVSINKSDDSEYMIDFVIDFNDVDFMNWRADNI